MTGYHLTLGYNSRGGVTSDLWAQLAHITDTIRRDPDRVVQEVIRENPAHAMWGDLLRQYAALYEPPGADLTIRVIPPTEEDRGQIMQLASGGGEERVIKEALRRAFCRLVIFEAHRFGIEVNLVVA